eukprot:TRINITY_DN62586_c0_g1_i1.p2 TRINITY_DN62586_c0_g1~~TRINITY_DN62586_c0_g1_i1.p2  ORF type:complete len:152 (-),score=21.19 TRINITY_DN62586_c0_g1_i1:115-570(-)
MSSCKASPPPPAAAASARRVDCCLARRSEAARRAGVASVTPMPDPPMLREATGTAFMSSVATASTAASSASSAVLGSTKTGASGGRRKSGWQHRAGAPGSERLLRPMPMAPDAVHDAPPIAADADEGASWAALDERARLVAGHGASVTVGG